MSNHYDRYNGMEELLSTNLAEVGTDCISREQAIKTVGWYSCHSGDELLFADNALRQLPIKESDWIPCSERLPEKEGLYLVTEIYKYSDGRKEYEVNVDRWSRNGSGREWSMCSNDMIFAWMPLPEPFKGVTE